MRKGDKQVGKPLVLFKDTKTNIESITNPINGMMAYATDTEQLGYYTDSWKWVTSGGGGASHDPLTVGDTSTIDLTLVSQYLTAQVIASGINHDQLLNTHNLTTDIDHDQLTNFTQTEHFIQSAISIPASQISDFDTEVSNNTDVLANTADRHTAVTVTDGDGVDLTLVGQDVQADISISPLVDIGIPDNNDVLIIEDITDNSIKKVLWSQTVSSGGGGSTSLINLTDTPSTYSGEAGKALVVNGTEDGIIFQTIASGGSGGASILEVQVFS